MNVATYNIHRGVGRDGRYEPQRILQFLKELYADIIALQEVAVVEGKSGNLLSWLATEVNMTAVAGPALSGDGLYGNALLTKLSVEQVRRRDLSVGNHEPRGVLDIDLNWNGQAIHVLNTHLGLWPLERIKQVQLLHTLLDVNERTITILMGDINEWYLWGKTLRILRNTFGRQMAPATFPSSWPLFALDRIWVPPETAVAGIEAHGTTLSRVASDHLPARAEIILGEPAEKCTKQTS